MTMTRPWRRMILHLLQIFLTLGLTFTANFFLMGVGRCPPTRVPGLGLTPLPLLVPVNDAAAAQVIRAELNDHPVIRQDPDVVHPHLAADVSQDLVSVVQLHPEKCVRERLHDRSLDLDGAVFLGHALRALLLVGDPARISASWRFVVG